MKQRSLNQVCDLSRYNVVGWNNSNEKKTVIINKSFI